MKKQITLLQLVSKLNDKRFKEYNIYLNDDKHKILNTDTINYLNNYVLEYYDCNDTISIILSE